MDKARTPYTSDVSDAEWHFLAPYLALMREDAPQRGHSSRDLLDALRYVVKTGCTWRYLPHDFPPWSAVYQQARRWLNHRVFEAAAHDLRSILRALAGRTPDPSAAVFDGRTLQSTPESGARAGYDGHKKKNGSKIHIAVDLLGHLLALKVTAANEQERAQVAELAAAVQKETGDRVETAFVDQGYTGEQASEDAAEHGMDLVVVRLAGAKKGFVLLPKRWVVERTFAWLGRFRRLARDYERLAETLAGWHWVAWVGLIVGRLFG
jgi:transposase